MEEAPEKIYVHKSQYWGWMTNEHDITKNGIEYVHKDAFIEKALKFLDENFFFDNKRCSIGSGIFDSKEEMFEKFKKYMEEE